MRLTRVEIVVVCGNRFSLVCIIWCPCIQSDIIDSDQNECFVQKAEIRRMIELKYFHKTKQIDQIAVTNAARELDVEDEIINQW